MATYTVSTNDDRSTRFPEYELPIKTLRIRFDVISALPYSSTILSNRLTESDPGDEKRFPLRGLFSLYTSFELIKVMMFCFGIPRFKKD